MAIKAADMLIARRADTRARADFATWKMLAKLNGASALPTEAQNFLVSYRKMLEKMPDNGYSEYEFTIIVDYVHPDLGRQKVEMLRCCVIGEKDAVKEGSEPTMKDLTFSCMQIKVNGKTMNRIKGTGKAASAGRL